MKEATKNEVKTYSSVLDEFLGMVKDYRKLIMEIASNMYSSEEKKWIDVPDDLVDKEEEVFEKLKDFYTRNKLEKIGLKLRRPVGESLYHFKFNLKKKKAFIDDLEAMINLTIGDIRVILNSGIHRLDKKLKENINPIKKITFLDEGTNGILVTKSCYINDDEHNVLKIRAKSKKIEELADFSLNRHDRIKEINFNKEKYDYINTNKSCVIYDHGKYSPTKILIRQGNKLVLNHEVEIRAESKSSFLRRNPPN